jgi:hypothetical protein
MPRIRSECQILIFSLIYIMCEKNLDCWFGIIYLQSFANDLPNAFTDGVICLSSYCAWKSGGTIFKTTQLPIRRGEDGHKKDNSLQTFVKNRVNINQHQVDWQLMYIYYPKPMDLHHPKDQHMFTHIQTLSHWDILTLSLWEVTWSSKVNIFTSNIGYIEQII